MDKLIKIAKLLSLLSILPLVAYLCLFLRQLTLTTAELQVTAKTAATTVQALPGTIDNRLASVQKDVLEKVDTVQTSMNQQISTVQGSLNLEVEALADRTDKRLASIQTDLNNQLTSTNNSVSTLVTAYSGVPAQVAARYNQDFASYFDCKKNNLCLQGQGSDTMFAIRDASRSTSITMRGLNETLPKIEDHILTVSTTFATDVPKITGNFASITDNVNRLTKPKWYDRLINIGVSGSVIYRNFNPVGVLIK